MEHPHTNAGPFTPLHPAVVHFPIALSVLSVGADAAGWATRHRAISASFFAAGWWALAAAVASAAVAIVLGISDMRRATIQEDAHRQVHHHMRIGFGVFVALAVMFAWRLVRVVDGEFSVGVAYLAAGVVTLLLIGYQGWLGGELVFRLGVGVATAPDPDMKGGKAETANMSSMQAWQA